MFNSPFGNWFHSLRSTHCQSDASTVETPLYDPNSPESHLCNSLGRLRVRLSNLFYFSDLRTDPVTHRASTVDSDFSNCSHCFRTVTAPFSSPNPSPGPLEVERLFPVLLFVSSTVHLLVLDPLTTFDSLLSYGSFA